MDRKQFKTEIDAVIDSNLEQSRSLMVGIVLKSIARELSSFDLDCDPQTKLPNHPLARLIYMYVEREIEERIACKHS
jgi:hypothetical protein